MNGDPYGIPVDFDEFWGSAVAEAKNAPLDYRRSVDPSHYESGHQIETFEFRGVGGERLHGWIAIPHHRIGRVPGFVWIPPYGRESLLPNQYGTREDMVSLSFNFHGLEAFHQESYIPARGYFAEGAEDPEKWIFRRMFQNAYMAVRILESLIEADEDRIGLMGMSQGAGIALWLSSWCPTVKVTCSDMPFLGGMSRTLGRSVYRYPLKELADFANQIPMGQVRLLHTLSYFDTFHQATRCKTPIQLSLGEKDPSVRPDTVLEMFELIPGPKRLIHYPGGHDWHEEMVQNNAEWFAEHLR